MKGFVGRFFSKSPAPKADDSEKRDPTPEELYAYDLSLIKEEDTPFYPLDQILLNSKNATATSSEEEAETNGDEVPPTNEEQVPKTRYVDDCEIGEGGTAVVYRAMDTRLHREVALKRFKDNGDGKNQDYLAELDSVARLRHPNVVSTFDADSDERGAFIVMELIDGIDTEDLVVKEKRTLDPNRFANFAIQALEGLHATHECGLLHLDLKPSNIMFVEQVSGRGIVKIVDFGRAKPLKDAEGKPPKGRGMDGSIYYSAPEQLSGEDLDQRADLYSMGCVFYWVLSGKMPFNGGSVIEVMSSHLQHIVTPLADLDNGVPLWLSDWVMGLISLRKSDRPDCAQEAIELLLNHDQGKNITRLTDLRA